MQDPNRALADPSRPHPERVSGSAGSEAEKNVRLLGGQKDERRRRRKKDKKKGRRKEEGRGKKKKKGERKKRRAKEMEP